MGFRRRRSLGVLAVVVGLIAAIKEPGEDAVVLSGGGGGGSDFYYSSAGSSGPSCGTTRGGR
jgi:hypothetical protein